MKPGEKSKRPAAEHLVEPGALDGAGAPGVADRTPEPGQRRARRLAPARDQPIGHDHGVHCAGRGAADPLDGDPLLGQEPVQHAPGKGAMGAAALESKIDLFHGGRHDSRGSGSPRVLRWY